MIEEILQREPFDEPECDAASRNRSKDRRFLARSCMLFVSVFIYVTYALLDSLMLGEFAGTILFLRLAVIAPLLLIIAIAFAKGMFEGREHFAFLGCVAVVSGSAFYMAVILGESVSGVYLSSMITAVFATWMLFLPSFRLTMATAIVAIAALVIVVAVSEMKTVEIYTNLYFVGMGCTVLAIGMFFLESTERSHRDYRRQLEKTISTLRDSEHRAVELYREAKQAEKAKDEFLAVVSHELRTPMNAIIGFSEIISTEMLGKINPPQYQEYSVYIKDSGQQLLSLINDILDVSRAEIDKMAFEMREFDVSSTLDSAVTACSANAETAGIAVVRHRPGLHDVMIRGDESRLLQAMTNIIGNAIKFSEENGTVVVNLIFTPDGELRFTATDTGIGISPEDIDNIKQPFKQAESAFVRNSGGLGLGLAICNIVANAHDGNLDIESTLGAGTTVSITLPSDCVVAADPSTRVAQAVSQSAA